MPVSVQDVVTDALSLVDFIQFGEAPPAEAQALAVRTLNGMLGEWSTKRYMDPLQRSYDCVPANPGKIIIGTDTAAVPPPDILADLTYIDSVIAIQGQVVFKLSPISLAEYMEISVKVTTAIPSVYAWDYQKPNGTIWLFPQALSNLALRVVGMPKVDLAGSQSTINLDDSYYEALTYNLAVRLYPHLKRDAGLDPTIIQVAQRSETGLKDRNRRMRMRRARVPFATSASDSSYWTSPLNTVSP